VARSHIALDDVDRAIVEQLQRDGRMPYTKLGSAVGLSEAAVRQRVQRLLDTGTIQVVAVSDPLSYGLRRAAMIGIQVEGDVREVARQIGELDDVVYLVHVAGGFDLLAEVVVADDEGLFELINARLRTIPGVRRTESFVYLRLAKQTFNWGAH
jgi:Lrp/AsnC family transcriptional regulator, regulator for asnA, asnC and gidA